MTADPRLTEERLRTWLDGNQLARERLCVQILSLDRRFRSVRPRQPKGGPDGGYDIEAIGADGARAVAAVGFRNSPSDTSTDLRWVREKFKNDLARAIQGAGAFQTFAFLTNVRLTVGARQRLLTLGRSLCEATVELIDREHMRLTLDTPEGLAARYQFLQIPMSDAEQAAFFARWGADLENLVTTSFAAVEERLQRIEFLHERERTLVSFRFYLKLKAATSIAELSHVRAILSMAKLTRRVRRSRWNIGVCNNSPERNIAYCGETPCLAGAFWLASPNSIRGTSASTWSDPYWAITASGGFGEFNDPTEVAKLGDIDDAFFAFFMNRRLFESLASAHIYANDYLIWSAKADELHADQPNEEPKTPWPFSATELSDEWVRVMPKGYTGAIHFSSHTPRRMWEPRRLEQAG